MSRTRACRVVSSRHAPETPYTHTLTHASRLSHTPTHYCVGPLCAVGRDISVPPSPSAHACTCLMHSHPHPTPAPQPAGGWWAGGRWAGLMHSHPHPLVGGSHALPSPPYPPPTNRTHEKGPPPPVPRPASAPLYRYPSWRVVERDGETERERGREGGRVLVLLRMAPLAYFRGRLGTL